MSGVISNDDRPEIQNSRLRRGQEIIMPVETAVATLSILASSLSITRSVTELVQKFGISKEDALARFRKSASKAENEILDRPGMAGAVLAMTIISSALLQQLEDEARGCERRHIEDRKNAGEDLGKKEVADIQAHQCMCSVLRAIKRYNKGELPGDLFKNWWDSYGCQ
jgi:hypothetical protein